MVRTTSLTQQQSAECPVEAELDPCDAGPGTGPVIRLPPATARICASDPPPTAPPASLTITHTGEEP